MVSLAQKKANDKWNASHKEYMKIKKAERWQQVYAVDSETYKQKSKNDYELNKVKKLAQMKKRYDFKRSVFGQLCSIY